MTRVEQVSIESDEQGFELHLLLDDDICTHSSQDGWLVLNIHGVAEELYDVVKGSIGPWLQERGAARASWPGPDAGDGYALDDPKHPTYHERYAGAADDARKARREG